MAETTGISWTDATFNPWIGCAKVSPGCDHCYAEVSTPSRTMRIVWGPHEDRKRTSAGNWSLPARWNSQHGQFFALHGRRRRVFCASLADVFDNRVDPKWRNDLWDLVRATPNLDWLILTKRIGNTASMLPEDWGEGYPNVWLGISTVNQCEADRDIPKLLGVPAKVRWLSMEPLLGPVVFEGLSLNPNKESDATKALEEIDWVVVGGESGPHARPMAGEWVASLREECAAARVPFFFKQWGGNDKNKGGCELAGVEIKAWPTAA
ncbi:phage Gp37/Gp68 family protein [Flavobacterium sp.]|uniref:phage Gp37/Gp68 family protein n=1 Tax=Flavobacterium sp. TaxID=239 RepID=UPI00261026DD|nr:phage Gp37/Gp68 family protein [Flavobacterium sp.]